MLYMQRALDLASKGGRDVMPNPQVGCVIVCDGNVIGEGWHKKFGEAHAEVNAIQSVQDTNLLKRSTLYVTLEPCSHHGKTPPCAELIVRMGIPSVVVASQDPNPLVAGRGIRMLEDAGIEVESGLFDLENRELNKRFFTFHEKKRPYVILKWAQTADGFIDKIRKKTNEPPQWITDEYCRTLVHKWRAREQSILAGARTVVMDNPRLDVRNWQGINPVRIILAHDTVFAPGTNILDGSVKTYIVTGRSDYPDLPRAEVIRLPKMDVATLLNQLYSMQIQSLFVEGGADVFRQFLEAGLWDEARVFEGKVKFGEGVAAPTISDLTFTEETISRNAFIRKYKNA